jgi:hypothetical protein
MHLLELRGFELSLRASRRRYLCVLHFLLKHRENNWDRHHPAPEGVQIGTGGSRQILYCTRLNQFSLLVFFTQHEGMNRETKDTKPQFAPPGAVPAVSRKTISIVHYLRPWDV